METPALLDYHCPDGAREEAEEEDGTNQGKQPAFERGDIRPIQGFAVPLSF
jgi:hypothetical protein